MAIEATPPETQNTRANHKLAWKSPQPSHLEEWNQNANLQEIAEF